MKLPNELMISISGIRGLAPGPLTPEIAYAFASAFSKISPKGPIIVSRDSRPSGTKLKEAVLQALADENREILDADLLPLPSTQVAVEEAKAAGAIDITASHNPKEWNGLKFLGPDGMFIRQKTLDALLKTIETNDFVTKNSKSKPKDIQEQAEHWHIQKLKPFSTEGKRLVVAIDAVNGAGSYIVPKLLEELGCDVIKLACDPNEPFPHTPEPTPKNLEWTQEQLKDKAFDLCVVVDPDADRLVLIDEKNNLLLEEMLLPLVAEELTAQGLGGKAVINLSTSRMIEDVGLANNFEVIRSKVGEINVVDKMRDVNAFMGGEGAGAAIDPRIHFGRDSLVGITYIVNLLRRTYKPLSQLVTELPKYEMAKTKYIIDRKKLETIYSDLKSTFKDASQNEDDGLRLSWDKKWIHVRPSNTEPVVRVIAEAASKEELEKLLHQAEAVISASSS